MAQARQQTIFRSAYDENLSYTKVPNEIYGSRVPIQFVGLLVRMLLMPKDCVFSIPQIAKEVGCSTHFAYKGFRLLIEAGHMIRYQETVVCEDGKSKRGPIRYLVFESPLSLEERVARVEAIAHLPYFSDISRPKKSRKKPTKSGGKKVPSAKQSEPDRRRTTTSV